jgi:hypothetical protein
VGTSVLLVKGTFFTMACNDAVVPEVFVYAAPHQLAIMRQPGGNKGH